MTSGLQTVRRSLPVIVVVGTGAYLLVGTLTLSPLRKGDACEYAQMTESLVNHGSPDVRPADLVPLAEWCRHAGFRVHATPPYFQARDGRRYSYHFWGYSLAVVPAKLALRALGLDELKAFQVTNALLLTAALSAVLFLLPWDPRWRIVLGLLSLLSPAFWFIAWPHPEIYSYALVVLALVFVARSTPTAAAVLAALASWQNSPLVVLVALILVKTLCQRASFTRKSVTVAIAAATAAVPYVDSLVKFGTASLLAKHTTAAENIAVARVIELFLDPSIGMLPYVPVALVLFVGVVAYDVVRRRLSLALGLFCAAIVMAVSATTTHNWNSDTAGPIRYAVWLLPLVFFGVVEAAARSRSPRAEAVWLFLLAPALIAQGLILYVGSESGGLVSRIGYLDHTRLAKLVLAYAPSVYSPTRELFTERTVHREGTDHFAVFFHRHRCRKALLRAADRDLLEAVCGGLPARVEAALTQAYDEMPRYVTFSRHAPLAPPGAEDDMASGLSVGRWLARGARPDAAAAQRVTLAVSRPVFTPGAPVQLSLRVDRLSTGGQGDLYVGVLSTSYLWVTTIRADGTLAKRSRFVGFLPSMRTRPIDLGGRLEIRDLLTLPPVAGQDFRPGDYEAFAVVTTAETTAARRVPNDVIAADVRTFAVQW